MLKTQNIHRTEPLPIDDVNPSADSVEKKSPLIDPTEVSGVESPEKTPSLPVKEVSATISASSIKSITSKDAAGKALEYKITMNAGLKITDIFSEQVLINENISLSENFKVQSQIYETERVENKIISNLVDRSSQQFMLRISQRNFVK